MESAAKPSSKLTPDIAGARFKNAGAKGGRPSQFFPLMDQVRASKRVGRAWINLLRSKPAEEGKELSPYNQWLEESESFEAQPRQAWFDTIGKAPLEAPVRPARLTPVRLMSPTPPPLLDATGPAPAGNLDATVGDDSVQESNSPTGSPGRRNLRRTFSRECCHIMKDQNAVTPFDAMKIYLACSFFAPCSVSFLRELLIVGGTAAWQGQSMNSGCNVYEEGQLGTSMFVLARGHAEVLHEGKVERDLGVGSHFGEAQVLGIVSRRLETVRAKSSLHILEITPSTLTRLLKRAKAEDESSSEDGEHERGSVSKAHGSDLGRALRLGGNAFAEERRHFEGEAVRLYRQHVSVTSHHHEQTGPSQPGGPPPSRLGRTTKAYLGKLAGLEDPEADSGAALDGSSGLTHIRQQEAFSRTSQLHKRSLPSSRYASNEGTEAGGEVASTGGAGGSSSAISRGNSESLATSSNTRERLVKHLVQSLRTDTRRGYMMPADSVGGSKRRGGVSKSRKPGGTKSVAGRRSTAVMEPGVEISESMARQAAAEIDEEEARTNDMSAPLDIQMLPPIGLLSPAQKHGLLQQLRNDARAKASHILTAAPGRKDRLESMASLLKRETRFQFPAGVSFCFKESASVSLDG